LKSILMKLFNGAIMLCNSFQMQWNRYEPSSNTVNTMSHILVSLLLSLKSWWGQWKRHTLNHCHPMGRNLGCSPKPMQHLMHLMMYTRKGPSSMSVPSQVKNIMGNTGRYICQVTKKMLASRYVNSSAVSQVTYAISNPDHA
jgi:hypothetical protein